MKTKILHLLTLMLFVGTCYSQRSIHPWGVWGYGDLHKDKDLDIYDGYGMKGFNVNLDWRDLEPTEGNYDWTVMDSVINILMNRDLWIGFLILFGKNGPDWLYTKVPKVITTGGNDDGPYPYYFDPDYQAVYFKMLKNIVDHIYNYPKETKSFIAYWQITEGSTGDAGPYKGTPTDSNYEISASDWAAFRRRVWDSLNVYLEGKKTYKILYNAGNDAEDLDYIEEKFPKQMNKDGNLSHKYSFDGELIYFTRQFEHIHDILFSYRTRGECQTIWNFSWWRQAPLKQSFTLVCSALAGGLAMFNIPSGWINQNITDKRPTSFFNEYAGWRTGTFPNKGFIALRDVIDFADSSRFPESKYGSVIDPQQRDEFEKKIQDIDSSSNGLTNKYWLKSQAILKYINPARVTLLEKEFKGQGAMNSKNDDQYHKDFGVLLARNYTKFIYQIDANATSIGRYRLGPASDMYGRYAREFKINGGAGEMYFKIGDSLLNEGGPDYQLKFTVVYFDEGTGKWSITNGSDSMFEFTKANTQKWIEATVTFDNFKKGQLLNGEADFSLKYISGDNTPFTLITVENMEKELPEPPVISSSKDALVPSILLSKARLGQNYPNPVANGTSIQYTIPTNTKNAQLIVTDNSGTIRKKLVLNAGEGTLNMDTYTLKSGTYNYSLYLNGKLIESKKMVIAR